MDNNTLIEQVVPKERNTRYGVNIALIILGAITIPVVFIIIALITKSAEGLIVGFILGILEFCFELNHDERKRCRKYRKKILPAFKSGTYDGSYVAFVRDFRAEAIRKHEELQKYMKTLKVEYEYAFLSSTLRIDKIIAKRKRRPILKVDVKQFDDFFPYNDKEMDKRRFNKVYHASGKEFSEENYVASFRSEAKGKCALIFTPNEKLLEGMKPYFDNELRKKLFLAKK